MFLTVVESGSLTVSDLPAAVPDDGSVAFTVQSAHGEAALVQSAVPAHRSLSVPTSLQGAVRLRGGAAAGDHSLMIHYAKTHIVLSLVITS